MEYDFKKIEKKWQDKWEKKKIFQVKESKKKKFYVLEMFPYPSGSGLHMGHALNYTIGDIYSRFKRMNSFNVLYPMGYDSLGLPAENAAIKEGIAPKKYTEKSIAYFSKQQRILGLSYDWSRMVKSHDPEYYKWDQWIFLKMFEKGLAYKKESSVNWCSKCNTVLANEQVVNGKCYLHSDNNVEIKHLNQWYFKITNYVEELNDFSKLQGWPDFIKKLQKNWIGKSYGTEIDFEVNGKKWPIFTTRPDTIFGVTFMVISAQHLKLIDLVTTKQKKDVEKFLKKLKSVSEKELEVMEKEGVFTGTYAINPINDEKVPVYAGNFVLADYGCGMVMAVPAHDQRDFEFAKKYKLKIKEVIKGGNIKKKAYTGEGKLVNSGEFNSLESIKAIDKITQSLSKKKKGRKTIQFKLRDWLISRQRYWGTPIPIVYCDKCAKKKIKILLIHGITGHNQENWFPWMGEQAKKFGVEFICPNIPNSDDPSLEKWTQFLKPYVNKLDENSIIIGHSLGATTAMHLIKKLNKRIGKLVMVAPTSKSMGLNNFRKKYQNKDYFSKETIDKIENFVNKKIDFKKIQKMVNEIIVYFSKDDPYIDFNSINYFKKNICAEFITFDNKGHFNEGAGIKEFPEILGSLNLSRNLGIVPISEKDLPIKLPEKVKFGKGNPLETNKDFVNTKCPKCKGKARRETDTMDTFVNSSWYFLRYCDSKNNKVIFDKKKANYWAPIDQYIGGKEHATGHLIYFRFYTKFLRDLGLLNFDEPALKLFNQGMLHASDGNKMSKSLGNVVDPIDVSKKYGIDAARLFLVSMAAPDKDVQWSEKGIQGSSRFIKKVMDYFKKVKIGKADERTESKLNSVIKEVTNYIDNFKYNLAVIKLRSLFDSLPEKTSKDVLEKSLKLLSPFCPHIAEELWSRLGNKTFISVEKWPVTDLKKINKKFEKEDEMVSKLKSDINNIKRILNKEDAKVYVYVLPNEVDVYKSIGGINLFAVNDKKKYDPENKSKKVKLGRPGIYLE